MSPILKREFALWIRLLAGPLVWLCSFEARFALAPWACTFQTKAALLSVAAAAILICAVSALLAWEQWKSFGRRASSAESIAEARANFMAICGIALSLGCMTIVVAQTIPELVLGACE